MSRGTITVIASHSRSKNGVASLAYGEAIQLRAGRRALKSAFLNGALRARLDCFRLRSSSYGGQVVAQPCPGVARRAKPGPRNDAERPLTLTKRQHRLLLSGMHPR